MTQGPKAQALPATGKAVPRNYTPSEIAREVIDRVRDAYRSRRDPTRIKLEGIFRDITPGEVISYHSSGLGGSYQIGQATCVNIVLGYPQIGEFKFTPGEDFDRGITHSIDFLIGRQDEATLNVKPGKVEISGDRKSAEQYHRSIISESIPPIVPNNKTHPTIISNPNVKVGGHFDNPAAIDPIGSEIYRQALEKFRANHPDFKVE